ncbi:hypothetical protein WJX72_004707 [[Myrmecia] bisecta]|uniref:Uncharacterized protein n=1 Tax=[Myrmecia] bisecta TaxID=41462 RepID=A0AAW1PNV5_9CHLO
MLGRRLACTLAKRSLLGARGCSTGSDLSGKLTRLKAALVDAVEGVSYVHQSANQAYLEADPSDREQKVNYLVRYQKFALQDLDSALKLYDNMQSMPGGRQALEALQTDVALAYADTLLARDNLNSALRRAEDKIRAGEITCDDRPILA